MDIGRGRATLRERTPEPIRQFAWRLLSAAKRQRPGLLMRYPLATAPPEVAVPSGFNVRSWRPGDDVGWLDLLQANGSFGDWTPSRLEAETAGLVREGQFFVTHDETIVAATGLLERPLNRRPALEVAWVARHPAYAGQQLGLATTVRAVQFAMTIAGPRTIYLYTDDFRLTAIAMYLRIGFVPDLSSHRSYARRWQEVLREIAERESRRAHKATDGCESAPGAFAGE